MLECRLFDDDNATGQRPAVLIYPDLWGLGHQACDWARRLAVQGFAALAVDPFGRGVQAESLEQGFALMDEVVHDPMSWRRRARCVMDHLAAMDATDTTRIGAIGFCFGGSTVLELARSGAPLAALICVHGDVSPIPAEEAAAIRGRLLICNGAEDPVVPVEQCVRLASDLKGSGIDWRYMLIGGAGHSFTNPDAARAGVPGVAYDEAATQLTWSSVLEFFRETLSLV